MFSLLLRQLSASIGVVLRTIKAFFTRQIYTVVARVRSTTSLTRQASKIAPKMIKTVTDVSQKPTKREDYFETGQLYIAKSLVVFVLIGIVAAGVVGKLVVWPLLRSWFFTAKFWEEDTAAADYNGKVVLFYDKEKEEPHYKGRLKKGRLEGKAEEYDRDGLILYDGSFTDGAYEGDGVLYSGGQKVYAGSFSGGKFEGDGRVYKDDAIVYEGSFADGLYDGKGTLYEDSQIVYEGGFQQGERSGDGTAYRNGKMVYEGEFAHDTYNGTGTEYRMGKLRYKGGFLDGAFDGDGTEYYSDGSVKYRGSFAEGVYAGTGVLNLKDETTIRGEFEDGETVGEATCTRDKILYYRGLLEGNRPQGAGVFLSKAGTGLFTGAAAAGVPDGSALLGMHAADVREMLGGTLEETMEEDGFVIRSRELGLAVYCSFAQADAESAVYGVYLYPDGAQAPLDTLLWKNAGSFERAARSCGMELPEAQQTEGTPSLPSCLPVKAEGKLYAAVYPLENGSLLLWSREPGGDLLFAEWSAEAAMPTVMNIDLGTGNASEEMARMMGALGLAKDSAAAAAEKDPFCGNSDVTGLLEKAKENDSLYPVLNAAVEYLRCAEQRSAAEKNKAIYQQMLEEEADRLKLGQGSEEHRAELEQSLAELELAESRYTVQMRQQSLTVEEATGLQLDSYDLQALPVAFDVEKLDADALGRVLIENAQKDSAAQILTEDGSQVMERVDEKPILDQMELKLLDLKLAYQSIGLARDKYVSALDAKQRREQEYQIGNTDRESWYQARIEVNDRRAALYSALADFTQQAAALDEESGGWIARAYGWYEDVLGR